MLNFLLAPKRSTSWWIIFIVILPLLSFPHAWAGGVRIGVLLPLSGPLAHVGSSAANALQLAVNQINSEGGILGMGVSLDYEDWGSNPKSILGVRSRYGSDVPILIGAGATSGTILASGITEKFGLPLIDCTSILPEYVLKRSAHTFALTGTVSQFVDAVGKLIPRTDMLIATENTDWGLSVRDSITALAKTGKISVRDAISVPYGRVDVFREIIDRLKKQRKAVLFQATGEDINAAMIAYFKESKFKPYGWVNMAAGNDPSGHISRSGPIVEGMLTVSSYSATLGIEGNDGFVKRFRSRFGEPPDSVAGMYWNCAWLVKDVLERAGSIDRRRVMEVIRKTDLQAGQNNIGSSPNRVGKIGHRIS